MKFKKLILAAAISSVYFGFAVSATAQNQPSNAASTTTSVTTGTGETARVNENLERTAPVAKLQGAKIVQEFMDAGAADCKPGETCTEDKRLIRTDGGYNLGLIQNKANSALGTQNLAASTDDSGRSISSQVGELAILCTGENGARKDPIFDKPQIVAGVAIKPVSCAVDSSGNATLVVSTCSAPAFGKPIENPKNAVTCSNDPADPSYTAPVGYVCATQACNTEAQGTQFGWSFPRTINYDKTSTDENNGLSLVFYPDLSAGVAPSLSVDSETLTAVKIVDTHYAAEKNEQAVGLKIALRYRQEISKEVMRGDVSIPRPAEKAEEWRTIEALNANPKLMESTTSIGVPSAACIGQVVNGLNTSTGEVRVCDETHIGPEGHKPLAVSAQVVSNAAQCTTTSQCISELVTTTVWTETCEAVTSRATKDCHTTWTWVLKQQTDVSTRDEASCRETRNTYVKTGYVTFGNPSCYLYDYQPPKERRTRIKATTPPCVPDATATPPVVCATEEYDYWPPTYKVQSCGTAPTLVNTSAQYDNVRY